MQIKFYSVSDESIVVNKTLGTAVTLSGTPKYPVDMLQPEFSVFFSGSFPSFNYAYVADLYRYYYITDIICESYNNYTIRMRVDVLRSYADGIKNLSGFVMRNQYTYDTAIIDPIVTTKSTGGYIQCGAGYSTGTWVIPQNYTGTTRHWIIRGTVQQVNGESTGKSESLVCDTEDMNNIMNAMLASAINPISSDSPLLSFSYTPVDIPVSSDQKVNSLTWNGIIPEVSGLTNTYRMSKVIDLPSVTWEFSVFDHHFSGDLQWANGTSNYMLRMLPFECVELPSDIMATVSSVTVKVEVNAQTGDAVLFIRYGGSGSGPFIPIANSNVNYTVRFYQQTTGQNQLTTNSMQSTGTSFLRSLPKFGDSILGADTIKTTLTNWINRRPMSSSAGGSSIIDTAPSIVQYYQDLIDIDPSLYGRPYQQYTSLFNITGFTTVKCHVDISGATDTEKQEIERLLESGVIL